MQSKQLEREKERERWREREGERENERERENLEELLRGELGSNKLCVSCCSLDAMNAKKQSAHIFSTPHTTCVRLVSNSKLSHDLYITY